MRRTQGGSRTFWCPRYQTSLGRGVGSSWVGDGKRGEIEAGGCWEDYIGTEGASKSAWRALQLSSCLTATPGHSQTQCARASAPSIIPSIALPIARHPPTVPFVACLNSQYTSAGKATECTERYAGLGLETLPASAIRPVDMDTWQLPPTGHRNPVGPCVGHCSLRACCDNDNIFAALRSGVGIRRIPDPVHLPPTGAFKRSCQRPADRNKELTVGSHSFLCSHRQHGPGLIFGLTTWRTP